MTESRQASTGRLTPGVTLRISAVAAGIVVTLGCLVLFGWSRDIEILKRVASGSIVMLPYTAIGFILGGVSLWLLRPRPGRLPGAPGETAGSDDSVATGEPARPSRWPTGERQLQGGRVSAVTLGVLGLAMFTQRIGGVDFGINLWFFPDSLRRYPYRPLGLMAVNSAFSFALLGFALLALTVRGEVRSSERGSGARPKFGPIDLSQLLTTFVFVIAFTALVGHAYGVQVLYSFDREAGMAVPTALGFAILATGILAARPGHGMTALVTGKGVAGVLVRPVLAAAVIVPFALGWLWLSARRTNLVTREEGVSLFVVLNIVTFVGLVLRSARVVQRSDRAREEARLVAERARTTAEAANQAKSEFLTVMSHELRTPLNAIAGHTQLLEMGLHGPVNNAQRDALARIDRSQRYLLRLINDVLNFARVESGRVQYDLRELELSDVVRDVAPMIESQLVGKGLEYSVSVAPGLTVRADREKVQQILLNLLSNALKFTPPGGQVRVESMAREGASGEAGMGYLRVSDSGIGIPRDRLETVFEPFVQVDTSLTRRQEGIGLGLAISRDVARGMGGDLWARSEPGAGSTFTLSLPIA